MQTALQRKTSLQAVGRQPNRLLGSVTPRDFLMSEDSTRPRITTMLLYFILLFR